MSALPKRPVDEPSLPANVNTQMLVHEHAVAKFAVEALERISDPDEALKVIYASGWKP